MDPSGGHLVWIRTGREPSTVYLRTSTGWPVPKSEIDA